MHQFFVGAEREFGGHGFDGDFEGAKRAERKRDEVVAAISSGIVGQYSRFTTPYGEKSIVYCDWTASGRLLSNIESYLTSNVMPFYGNTHTSTSITGHQSTCFRSEARQIIAQSVNAKVTGKAAEDVVLFTGNGTTSAVNKLVHSLGLNIPLPFQEGSVDDSEDINPRPLVFTSSYEHHSNLLPWRESFAQVVTIKYSQSTGVCLVDLEQKLRLYSNRKSLKIGTFSAASNVTGVLTAVDRVSVLLHSYGALAFFDYATAAPYTVIDMNPALDHLAYKDAIFFSGHKFIGGPGAPGVLIVKRNVMVPRDSTPPTPGGGTVFYVTGDHHRYLSNREEREEGGTPYILGDIKLGLVMHLKQSVGSNWIQEEELRISAYAQLKLEGEAGTNIILLGRASTFASSVGAAPHLPIFSFLVRAGARFLHHNFVCALLNDLFGVQSRGGCQCAGPFSQQLLGLSAEMNAKLEASLLDKQEVLRPGYSRISIPYWTSKEEIDYILDAVIFVALHGHKFLSAYRYNHRTGEWAHTTRLTRFPERQWISQFDIGAIVAPISQDSSSTSTCQPSSSSVMFKEMMQTANAELAKIENSKVKKADLSVRPEVDSGGAISDLRWFFLAGDDCSLSAAPPLGPIQPPSVEDIVLEQYASVWEGGETRLAQVLNGASAYAQHRADKLQAHVGGGRKDFAPRYVQLASASRETARVGDNIGSGIVSSNGGSTSSGQAVGAAVMSLPPTSSSTVPKQSSTNTGNCLMGSCSTAPVPSMPQVPVASAKPLAPPKKLMKLVGQCVREWNMIEEGDKLCLGLSGGKDSLSLLHVLIALQKRAPIRFSIACATVDPQTLSFDPSPLIPYMQSLGITYHYLSQPIVDMAASRLQGDSLCAFCARFKRGLLYSCCRDNGYNKLLLAQHLDDFAESFLMSALHNGQMRTMKANYKIDAGDLTVIRPFAYVREQQTRQFAVEAKLPIINENCPACFEQPKERARIKQLLLQEESMVPALFFNLRRALVPMMSDEIYTVMGEVTNRISKAGLQRYSSQSTRGKKISDDPEDHDDGEGGGEATGPHTKRPRKGDSTCGPGGCEIDFD